MPTKLCLKEATEWAEKNYESIIHGSLPIGYFLGKYIIPTSIKSGFFRSNLNDVNFFSARHFIENDTKLSRVNENKVLFCDVISGGGFSKLYHKLGLKVEFEILRSVGEEKGYSCSPRLILNPEDDNDHFDDEQVMYKRIEITLHARVY